MQTKQLLPILFLLFTLGVQAQQLPLWSVPRDHWNLLNPAALSNNYLINEMNFSASASYRQQWLGLDQDSPNTQLLNFEYIPREQDNIVTGGHIIRDQTGLLGQVGLYGQFAYRLELGLRTEQSLLIGLSAGLVQYRAKIEEIAFATPELMMLDNDQVIYPDFGFGAFYHYSDLFYAGVSVPQTLGLQTIFRDAAGERAFSIRRLQHFYGVVGGYINVDWFGASSSFLEPSVWVRYAPRSPLSFDANVRYQVSEFFWAGIGGGIGLGALLSGTMRFETGLKLGESINLRDGQLKVGFAFDLPLTVYRRDFGSTLEFTVIYSWYN